MASHENPDGQLRLEYIHPHHLQKYWPKVREGLGRVHQHSADTWIPEDVYVELKANRSTLHMGYVDSYYKGFFILTPTQGYDGPVLHVWALYSEGKDFDLFHEGMKEVLKLAAHMQAKRITFTSPRKGWERQAVKLGFSPRSTLFSMEV